MSNRKLNRLFLTFSFLLLFALITQPLQTSAQNQFDTNLFSALRWRLVGPFRGGRVTAVAGVPGDPNTFYFGTPGGGVWKTTDGAQVWRPIFDSVPVPSIGALAVAPSDPNILYVGTGEQTKGHGVYRSSDAGKTWNGAGLEDVPFIQSIIVDPQNPQIVVAAGNSVGFGILWRPLPDYAKTANRGIFKTEDGGKSWKKVYTDDNSLGVVDMCADPGNPHTLYAVIYHPASGSGDSEVAATSEIVKSTDGGSTWSRIETKGLPEKARDRMGIAVAPGDNGQRLYAIVEQGFFRSDDGGATWKKSTEDPRIIGNNYFSRIFVDPNNPDVLYVAQTSLYRSTDGGKNFEAFVGAPSGDDFHVLWIDPHDSARMILGVDQGAIVTVDRGKTWSSWYNQPTGQFYHVSTDNQFPYHLYGAQQDSGTAETLSRSDYGEILLQDWHSIGGFEYAYIAADPANSNFVYSGGWYGSVVRHDDSTGQIATVFERGNKYRVSQMPPLAFSPQDPSLLYFGTQFLMKTRDGGKTWQEISPDLTGYTGPAEEEKPDPDKPRPPAITAIAPSPVQAGEIWVGTTNRVVQLTRDAGAHWQNVSPPDLSESEQVLYVEASHHAPGAAYLTLGATRQSTAPDVLRTHDYGKTWQKIANGFPLNEMVRVVREDPKRKGLLYAGTDTGIFISFDDGDHWQPFSLNLPPTPITDLQVHDNDLTISTFGRALWILDDLTPLREMSSKVAESDLYLFAPEKSLRVRWDNYEDTPYPIETPAGQNPPDGAILDYFLKSSPASELTLTVYDEKGAEVAEFSTTPKKVELPPPNVPEYWFAPPTALSKAPGVNRFVWDLRYPSPPSLPYGYFNELLGYTEYTLADHAIPELTPRQQPRGPLVVPGKYTVELDYNGKKLRQPLIIDLDPRVHASPSDLVAERDLALETSRGMKSSYDAYKQVTALRDALADANKNAKSEDRKDVQVQATALQKNVDGLLKGTRLEPGFGPVNRDLTRLMSSVESADMQPAETVHASVQLSCEALAKRLAAWQKLNQQDISSFNTMLTTIKKPALPVVSVAMSGCNK